MSTAPVRPSTDGGRRAGGRYVLGDLLGRGGMAEVFAGYAIGDHGFQKPVAIKRLLPELANDHVFVERLIGEAKLLVGMTHGNVVSVLDLARDGDDVFLVMEFVDGPSLRQLLKARGTRGLPLGVASYIIQSAAAGLEFAHVRPGGAIIHADISPSNLLLTTSGEVRVADFGIARREGGSAGIVEGKWAYMAPEQARGESLTPRSDVFALGVVLYELICGAHPFGRQITAEERDSQPLRVIPPRVVRPSIPAGLDAICMRALAHDPRERYARMQHLIDAIVEERFTNHWREGASDLAQAIRECAPEGAVVQPRTMVTDRPVTILTRSLLKGDIAELVARRPSRPSRSDSRSESYSMEVDDDVPKIADSNAQTRALQIDDVVSAAANLAVAVEPPTPVALPPMPAILLRADGTPMPPFKLMVPNAMPSQDLASVVGGNTVSSATAGKLGGGQLEHSGSNKWAIAILSVAAVVGVVAAIAISRSSREPSFGSSNSGVLVATNSDRAAAAAKTPPPTTPTQAAAVAPAPAPPPAPPPPIETTKDEPVVSESPETQTTPTNPSPAVPTNEVAPPTAPAPSGPSGPSGPTTNRKKDPGFVRAQSEPETWVSINNERQRTPARFSLAPGRYTVRFQSDDGRSVTKQITVKTGNTARVSVNLDEDN